MALGGNNSSKMQAIKAAALKRQKTVPGLDPQDTSLEGSLKQVIADQEMNEPQKMQNLLGDEGDAAVDAPLVRLVNSLLGEAVKGGASDVHIEPFESMLRVRFRVDGEL